MSRTRCHIQQGWTRRRMVPAHLGSQYKDVRVKGSGRRSARSLHSLSKTGSHQWQVVSDHSSHARAQRGPKQHDSQRVHEQKKREKRMKVDERKEAELPDAVRGKRRDSSRKEQVHIPPHALPTSFHRFQTRNPACPSAFPEQQLYTGQRHVFLPRPAH